MSRREKNDRWLMTNDKRKMLRAFRQPHGRRLGSAACRRSFFPSEPSVSRERDSLVAAGRLIDRDLDRAEGAVRRLVGRVVSDYVLRAEIANDLVGYLRQLGQ